VKISELFYSVQGEGKRTGNPSFFIRTNHCNLRCQFASGNLCDTSYTSWFPDNEYNLGDIPIDDIINEYQNIGCDDVVITGGEPTIFPHELRILIEKLRDVRDNLHITLETNGTNFGDYFKNIDLISVSPKLSSSTPYKTSYEKMHDNSRFNKDALFNINQLKNYGIIDVQWKFVFSRNEDLEEIYRLKELLNLKHQDIYLMPEGINKKDLEKNREHIIEICKNHNFRYSDRLHIITYGNKRGL